MGNAAQSSASPVRIARSAATSAAIATPHRLATAEGERVLERGGSAVDAAIAAAAVLSVVYPHNVSIGGDLVALVRRPDGETEVVNASGPAASAESRERLAGRHGDRLPDRGVDTVTVPGAVAGWSVLHASNGILEWPELLATATRLAADGVPVAPSLARALRGEASAIDDEGFAEVFRPGGRSPRAGDVLRQPALARTLALLRIDRGSSLFRGPVAADLVAGLRALGSRLTVQDLAAFAPEVTAPLVASIGPHRILTSGPNTQGFVLLRVLAELERAGASGTALGRDLGLLLRLFESANAIRDERLADPRHAEVDVDALLHGDPGGGPSLPRRHRAAGDTVGIAAVDARGGAVALIQSLYFAFGSGVLEPRTGILLQNRGTSFSLTPGSPNVVAGGKRPLHTLMPVLVAEGDELRYVSATMGGQGQPQIHARVLLRAFSGATAAEAVSAPRAIVGVQDDGDTAHTVGVEPGADPDSVLEREAFAVRRYPGPAEVLGHANLVTVHPDGEVDAAADPRSDGAAAVVRPPG